jgi:hypothetical protein
MLVRHVCSWPAGRQGSAMPAECGYLRSDSVFRVLFVRNVFLAPPVDGQTYLTVCD